MKEYKYYTPVSLMRLILSLIPNEKVESIVDICCGSWNLLRAAYEKYPNAKIVGVDIDESVEKYKINNSNFEVCDGRDYSINSKKAKTTFDLILSNPPFGALKTEEQKFKKIIDGFPSFTGLQNKRYECELMQANFLLTHDSSILVFILPSTFILGTSLNKARCQIANEYCIQNIIELPADTFKSGKINTYAVIMKRGHINTSVTKLYSAVYTDTWSLFYRGQLSFSDISIGKWWLLCNEVYDCHNLIINRGKISSNCFSDVGRKVLHSSAKKRGKWAPSLRMFDPSKIDQAKIVYATIGDILINRIGHDAGYWCVNELDKVAISDCLIVIHKPTESIKKSLENMSDDTGRLNIPLRGVATRYITHQDVLRLIKE